MARILAIAGLTAVQTAIVTAHQARVDEAFCCDFVAEHIAAELRPHLFASVVLESLAEGKPMVIGDGLCGEAGIGAALKACAEGKPETASPCF